MSKPLTDRQADILVAINAGLNQMRSADSIASALGYRPAKSGRLAVSSTLRALQKRNLVGRIPPEDQWDHATYFLKSDGKDALAKINSERAPL